MTSGRAIGIDIGGTHIAVGAVAASGEVIAKQELPTNAKAGFDGAITRIAEAAHQAAGAAGWSLAEVDGIGIGCTGPVNPSLGTIDNPFTLPTWEGRNIVAAVENALGIKTHLENDANAALLGELLTGAGRGVDNVVMLTLGTGVGGAVLIGGNLYRGIAGTHPELGHMPIDPNGPACYCGQTGCLESLASGAAIDRAAQAAGMSDGREVFTQWASGNVAAENIVVSVSRSLGRALGVLFHTFLPELIILGGGVMEGDRSRFLQAATDSLCGAALIPSERVRVEQATLGNLAGVVGAASLTFAN